MLTFADSRTLARTRSGGSFRVMKSPTGGFAVTANRVAGYRISFRTWPSTLTIFAFSRACTLKVSRTVQPRFSCTPARPISCARRWVPGRRLASEPLNDNLPGFITIGPSLGNGGPRNWSNAFLPAVHQGTALGRAGMPAEDARIRNLVNPRLAPEEQRRQLDLLQALNAEQLRRNQGDAELEAAIASFELAFRMQTHAPGIFDRSRETPETLRLYGIGDSVTDDFGRQCLLARRLSEAGVRYVQITYGDNSDNPAWDQHANLPKHADHARAVDRPVAGLLADLKQRGLLNETLVWWGGEFGRTPYAEQNGTGRDHNPGGFTMFLAGGGVKPGFLFGATDEFGFSAIEDKVHMHDLHATILHLLGLDHTRLTFRHAGRDFRLTDVSRSRG